MSLDDLGQRFATGKKVQPQLVGAHDRQGVHVVDILNHAIGESRPNWDSATPNSLLRTNKLWHLMPAMLHSPDRQATRRQRVLLAESGEIVLLLPLLMVFTRRGDSR